MGEELIVRIINLKTAVEELPPSRDRSLALTHLEEAEFWLQGEEDGFTMGHDCEGEAGKAFLLASRYAKRAMPETLPIRGQAHDNPLPGHRIFLNGEHVPLCAAFDVELGYVLSYRPANPEADAIGPETTVFRDGAFRDLPALELLRGQVEVWPDAVTVIEVSSVPFHVGADSDRAR